METVVIEAQKREERGKKLKGLRNQGLIPAVVYGKKFKSLPIVIDRKTFEKRILASGAGKNALISLKMTGAKEVSVITNAIQRDPLTDDILHIDFTHIVMDEAIKTRVPIELVGLPIGVKETGGVLIHGLREVEVECLPKDIPDKFSIDVSELNIGDSLHVSDLTQVAKVKVLANPSEMIANCSPPTKEEVVAAPIPTPEEVAAAAAAPVVAEEEVKEKSAPGAAPPEKKPGKEAAPEAKPEKK